MLKVYQTATMPKALPLLVEKIYSQNQRMVLLAQSQEEALWLDHVLWTYKSLSFLPHGCEETEDQDPLDHPLWISCVRNNVNKANVLLSAHFLDIDPELSAVYQQIVCFARLDETDRIQAQKAYLSQWWVQDEAGRWDKSIDTKY